jgi:hypothetical protein
MAFVPHHLITEPAHDMASRSLPWTRIAAYGFLLNAVWEFGQCTVLYDMWSWGFWRATVWMWGAIVGDVGIVLGVAGLARLAVGRGPLMNMSLRGWSALLLIGLVASVGLEWVARALELWGYSTWMPTITVLGRTVGLSPIVQVTSLPALSVAIAIRWTGNGT